MQSYAYMFSSCLPCLLLHYSNIQRSMSFVKVDALFVSGKKVIISPAQSMSPASNLHLSSSLLGRQSFLILLHKLFPCLCRRSTSSINVCPVIWSCLCFYQLIFLFSSSACFDIDIYVSRNTFPIIFYQMSAVPFFSSIISSFVSVKLL